MALVGHWHSRFVQMLFLLNSDVDLEGKPLDEGFITGQEPAGRMSRHRLKTQTDKVSKTSCVHQKAFYQLPSFR